MARRRRRSRRRKGFVAIPFNSTLTLGTLASDTVLTEALLGNAFGEDFYAISVDANVSLIGKTASEGPITWGYAHGDLAVGEIKECLNAELEDPDNIIAREQARRPVRRGGIFSALVTSGVQNDGNPVRTKLKMSIGDGHNINQFAYNHDPSALTTGTKIQLVGTIYGRWQR